MNQLAGTLLREGKFEDAGKMLREILDIQLRVSSRSRIIPRQPFLATTSRALRPIEAAGTKLSGSWKRRSIMGFHRMRGKEWKRIQI
jgi:hypothetical protein